MDRPSRHLVHRTPLVYLLLTVRGRRSRARRGRRGPRCHRTRLPPAHLPHTHPQVPCTRLPPPALLQRLHIIRRRALRTHQLHQTIPRRLQYIRRLHRAILLLRLVIRQRRHRTLQRHLAIHPRHQVIHRQVQHIHRLHQATHQLRQAILRLVHLILRQARRILLLVQLIHRRHLGTRHLLRVTPRLAPFTVPLLLVTRHHHQITHRRHRAILQQVHLIHLRRRHILRLRPVTHPHHLNILRHRTIHRHHRPWQVAVLHILRLVHNTPPLVTSTPRRAQPIRPRRHSTQAARATRHLHPTILHHRQITLRHHRDILHRLQSTRPHRRRTRLLPPTIHHHPLPIPRHQRDQLPTLLLHPRTLLHRLITTTVTIKLIIFDYVFLFHITRYICKYL